MFCVLLDPALKLGELLSSVLELLRSMALAPAVEALGLWFRQLILQLAEHFGKAAYVFVHLCPGGQQADVGFPVRLSFPARAGTSRGENSRHPPSLL